MHFPIAFTQLFHRPNRWKNQAMFETFACSFAVNSLRTRYHDFLDRQIFFSNDFQHLRGAERVDVYVFRDLGHVTAVSSLMKDDVDLIECGCNCVTITNVSLDEICVLLDPSRLAALVRVRLKVVQHANFPTFAHEEVRYMRADEASTARNQRAFSVFHLGQIRSRPSRSIILLKNSRVFVARSFVDLSFGPKSSLHNWANV